MFNHVIRCVALWSVSENYKGPALFFLLALIPGAFITGCSDDDSRDEPLSDSNDIEPPNRSLIQELRLRVDGTLLLIPYVNGVRPRNVQGEPLQWFIESTKDADISDLEAYLTAPSNDVALEIIFVERQGYAHLIAVSGADALPPGNEGVIDLENIFWIFQDQDQDELFDAEEIGIRPVDCDGDNMLTFEDSDSDNDGIVDGLDPTPNGPPCV